MSGESEGIGNLSVAEGTQGSSATLAVFQRLPNKRFAYVFDNKRIYEWEQTLDQCIVYIVDPPAGPININILPKRLTIGLKNGVSPFIDEQTFDLVDISESTWTKEDGMIVVYLQKARKGQVWEALLLGKTVELVHDDQSTTMSSTSARLDASQLEQVRKEIMLERYGEEYPGMDFSEAVFNGAVPDPRSHMGGVKHK